MDVIKSEDVEIVKKIYMLCDYDISSIKGDIEVEKYFIGLIDLKPAGVVRLCREAGCNVLRGLNVIGRFQGGGLGKLLVKRVIKEVKLISNGENLWCLPYRHLIGYYEEMGFRLVLLDDKKVPKHLIERQKKYKDNGLETVVMMFG